MIEFFTIISGIALIVMAFLPEVAGRNVALFFVGGLAFVGYGIAMALATSGTWYYSHFIFIIPFLLVLHYVALRRSGSQAPRPKSDTGTWRSAPTAPSNAYLPPTTDSGLGGAPGATAAEPAFSAWTGPPTAHLEESTPAADEPFAPWDPTTTPRQG